MSARGEVAGTPPRVAFQGERGAFSEEAAVKLLGAAATLVPRPTFESLFAAVGEGAADLALAPVENTLAGSVQRVYDLLPGAALHVAAEVVIRVRHFLIGCPGAAFESVRTVESHPVALAQCGLFFAAHPGLRRVASEDTAGSVAGVVRRGDPARAAIAGRRAAEIYGGRILREGLEDHAENYTRFLLLAPEPARDEAADKLSLVVTLAHAPGALWRALEPFARRGLGLLKIETRPARGRPWEYDFFLDFGATRDDAASALEELRAEAAGVRVLGHYRSARSPE